jgi:hypothetical protein
MKFEEVLPELRKGLKVTLTDLPGNIFSYESDKLFTTAEESKKEFTQLESYLASDGWALVSFNKESVTLSLKNLKEAWDSTITPDTSFSTNATSAKFIAFAKALGF